jgi:hypothetical protein
MTENYRPKTRDKEIIVQDAKDETLVYHLGKNKAFLLNSTIAEIWRNCNGLQDIKQLSNSVSSALGEKADENIIKLALDSLQKEDLLEESLSAADFFRQISRRELVRKAGLSSMIALPILMKIVAPTSANAASNTASPCVLGPGAQQYFGDPYSCPPNDNPCAYTNCAKVCCPPVDYAQTEPNGAIFCRCAS